MIDILHRIHSDHGHMIRLMDLLEMQVRLFQRGQQPDYALMLGIMQYMLNYPDLAHHYVEELIFEKLRDSIHGTPSHLKRKMAVLAEQHDTIHRCGLTFTDMLQAVVDGDSIVARDRIEAGAYAYIELLRDHIRQEEADVLPEAERALSAQEWAQIRVSVPIMSDWETFQNRLAGFDTLYAYLTGGR